VSEKRALIVDDSKSARVVLSRMLEKHDLAVDTRDSAEHALEYLKAHRPDVIFMDHLMPGMDGLAAVQAIRSNPDTSTIPIMMYTSQEGELYLDQARALGATGVLPKRIGSTEVSRILQDLRLLDSPAALEPGGATSPPASHSGPIVVAGASAAVVTGTSAGAVPGAGAGLAPGALSATAGGLAGADAPAVASEPALAAEAPAAGEAAAVHVVSLDDLQRLLEPMLKQHSADLRRFVVASLDSFAARVNDVRAALPPVAPVALVPVPPAPTASETRIDTREPAPRPTGWIALAAVASLAAATTGALAWYQQRQIDSLAASLASASRTALVATPALAAPGNAADQPPGSDNAAMGRTRASSAPESAAPAAAVAPAPAPPPAIAPVAFPYGAPPFAEARLARLEAVLADLEGRSARGVLTATLHSADFCLTGNPGEGYALAPDEMPADRCDVVGNPHYDGLRAAQRQGAEYADVVAALRTRTAGALDVRVVDAGRQGAIATYPSGGGASAQQWNAAAATNQRIEFAFAPSTGSGATP
jgi:CheY-like chemotaxis protein